MVFSPWKVERISVSLLRCLWSNMRKGYCGTCVCPFLVLFLFKLKVQFLFFPTELFGSARLWQKLIS